MKMKKLLPLLIILTLFETVAVTLWLTKSNIFYLFNFSYIGLSISLGIYLYMRNYRHARRVVQLLVGSYMLVYLGLICGMIVQIEGFSGITCSPAFLRRLPYIMRSRRFSDRLCLGADGAGMPAGPLWCSIFCRTRRRKDRAGGSGGYSVYHICRVTDIRFRSLSREGREYRADNVHRVHRREYRLLRRRDRSRLRVSRQPRLLQIYLPDNRFSEVDEPFRAVPRQVRQVEVCFSCGKCRKVCPMDVDPTDNTGNRKNGTECILCMECVKNCPKKAL